MSDNRKWPRPNVSATQVFSNLIFQKICIRVQIRICHKYVSFLKFFYSQPISGPRLCAHVLQPNTSVKNVITGHRKMTIPSRKLAKFLMEWHTDIPKLFITQIMGKIKVFVALQAQLPNFIDTRVFGIIGSFPISLFGLENFDHFLTKDISLRFFRYI